MKQVQRMHKVFGEKKNEDYFDRKGAYLIAIEQNRIAVIKTPKGYFLLGGGLEENETDTQCICRECLEETGYKASVKEKICSAETYCEHPEVGFFHPIQTYYLGELIGKVQDTFESDHELVWIDYDAIKGKLYSQMQNWAIEQAIDQ